MKGVGHAHGAITILNATATGRGCSLATDHGMDASWTWVGPDGGDDPLGFAWQNHEVDDALATQIWHTLKAHYGIRSGARAATQTKMPPARGLKTSSSAATALIRAAAAAHQTTLPDEVVEHLAVTSCRQAGVTITGAYDDQVAVTRGGCHLTNNAEQEILERIDVSVEHVAVWIPDESISKNQLHGLDTSPIKAEIEAAEQALLNGELAQALQRNGDAFHRLYEAAGLPVTRAPADLALKHGALAAGLSGTGPAVAALFDDVVALPRARGGLWMWMKPVTRP